MCTWKFHHFSQKDYFSDADVIGGCSTTSELVRVSVRLEVVMKTSIHIEHTGRELDTFLGRVMIGVFNCVLNFQIM